MTLIWLAVMGAIFGFTLLVPNFDGNPVFSIVIIALVIVALVFTFRIGMRPAGKPYIQITTVAGLRGEFSVARHWPVIIGLWVGVITLVCIIAIPSEPKGSSVIYGWMLTAIIPLVVYGLVLLAVLNRVTAFRVDDNGSMFIRHGQREWTPLRLSDYGRVTARTVSGRHGGKAPLRIEFLDPLTDSVKPFSLPVTYVRSRQYGTMAHGTVIHDFFYEMYAQLGYRIERKSDRWEAQAKVKRDSVVGR